MSNFDQGGTMQGTEHNAAPLTAEQLAEILERLATAETVTDVNIAAGIALTELRGIDD
jgi:hypothetical protein